MEGIGEDRIKSRKKCWKRLGVILLIVILLGSLGFNAYLVFFGGDSLLWRTYLQSPEEIEIMELGVLRAHANFREGEALAFQYDFANEEYPLLLSKYEIEKTAGSGCALDRALRLMDAYSGRLTHRSSIKIEPDQMNALYLLDYSLDQKEHGIYCRAKAQILNEMCLALGIYARKVWINPISAYDSDCHVVNEVWDEGYGQWIMLDITNNSYWIDETGKPLSVLEIHDLLSQHAFCTPAEPGDDLSSPEKLKEKHLDTYLYIAKNMVYMEYMGSYTVGETEPYYMLFPEGLPTKYTLFVSRESVEARPQRLNER